MTQMEIQESKNGFKMKFKVTEVSKNGWSSSRHKNLFEYPVHSDEISSFLEKKMAVVSASLS